MFFWFKIIVVISWLWLIFIFCFWLRYCCKHDFKFDIENHKFYEGEYEIPLSKKLLLLVQLLSKHKGTAVSYTQISDALWGEEQNINTLRAVVHRLKHKVPQLELHMVSKGGYILY